MEMDWEKERAAAAKVEILRDLSWEESKVKAIFMRAVEVKMMLLLAANDNPALYSRHVTLEAVRRYETCWLPLAASWSHPTGRQPIPPLDVQWIWHLHMLNPVVYAKECREMFGHTIECHFQEAGSLESGLWELLSEDESRQIWAERYPEEPYDPDLSLSEVQSDADISSATQSSANPSHAPTVSRLSMEFVSASARQRKLFYQVWRPWMLEPWFLERSYERYKMFLYLVSKKVLPFSVPTYDIDIMWHTHTRIPVAYEQDTVHLLGMMLNHDDSVIDRSPGSKLATSYSRTMQYWYELYGYAYERAGAMYLGEEPKAPAPIPELPSLTAPHGWIRPKEFLLSNLASLPRRRMLTAHITVNEVQNLEKDSSEQDHVVALELLKNDDVGNNRLLTYKRSGKNGRIIWGRTFTHTLLEQTKGVRFTLVRPGGTFSFSRDIGSCEVTWNKIQSLPPLSMDESLELSLKTDSKGPVPLLSLSISTTPFQPAPYILRVVVSSPIDDHGSAFYKGSGEGIWSTRTVFDTTGAEQFVISTRVSGDPFVPSNNPRNVKKLPFEQQKMQLIQGGWASIPDSTNWQVPGKVIASATPKEKDLSKSFMRSFQIFPSGKDHPSMDVDISYGADTNVENGDEQALKSLTCSFQDPEGFPIRVHFGRHVQYSPKACCAPGQKGSDQDLEYLTFIRFNHDYPLGRGTALMNFKTGYVEVDPTENVSLVLLTFLAIVSAVSDINGAGTEELLHKLGPSGYKT